MSLIFRNINDLDFETQMKVREWRNEESIRKNMYDDSIISEENHRKWLNSLKNNTNRFVFVIYFEGREIGVISIDNIDYINKKCEWAFYIFDANLRGKGIGKRLEISMIDYIFNVLKMEKLNCAVLSNNLNVVEMHKHFGFKVEGILRQNYLKNGKRIDVYLLGMLKDEWTKQRELYQDVERAQILLDLDNYN